MFLQSTVNGQISYSILDDGARKLFSIDDSGNIFTVRTVNDITQATWNVSSLLICISYKLFFTVMAHHLDTFRIHLESSVIYTVSYT